MDVEIHIAVCEQAKLWGDLQNSISLYDPWYGAVHAEYEYWSNACDEMLEQAIQETEK